MDIRGMQALTQRLWPLFRAWHIGDLAWQRFRQAGCEHEWESALWEADGEVLAFGWAQSADSLMMLVDPAHHELADEVLARLPRKSVTVVETEKHLVTALQRAGYSRVDDPPHTYVCTQRALADVPEAVLPDGFVARHVGPEDLERRVDVHRAAWHPSRMTAESYWNVMAAWPYRADLDWVVEAPDGTFAANCLMWLDSVNRVAELEPVGVDPRFRRMGLGRAVCLAAMRAAGETGADHAVVFPVEGTPAFDLYTGLGFTPYARTETWSRC